ncbi:MFS transporter [Paenarthrobacter nitroguajacolicus]|uniref:MFS transporter n=1 Tax=Paenarthrobacter nitroguajacolicus TaxID=211146 RepID=UPI0028659927|nr:MFS transporter [Paenarthrobacter nitroguajacolicus]MDR6639550.1 MFS family permease [Paenarthrobacter nitroguajacolicus]
MTESSALNSSHVRTGSVVAVLAFAGIVASMTHTLVVPLLVELPRIFATTPSNTSWVITVTLLASAVVTPVAGRLGDMFGKRLVIMGSFVPLILGSALCAMADSVVPMIAGRALQGLAAGMVPLGISFLKDLLPPAQLRGAIALVSSSLGIGGALGLPISAAVVQFTDWRILFWATAAVSLLSLLLIWKVAPDLPVPENPGKFDFPGALGLSSALICLLLAVSKGGDWGWLSPAVIGLVGGAVFLFGLWGCWELRTRDALVDLRVTIRRAVLLTNVASILLGFAMYARSLILPQVLQLPTETGYGLGQSMLQMGFWMAPAGLAMMLVSPLGAKLSASRGPKTTLIVGALITSSSYAVSVFLMDILWGLVVANVIGGIGLGFAYGALPALIMGAVPGTETGSANSFNALMLSIGTSVSGAVIGVVLAQMTTHSGSHLVPTADGFRTGLYIGCAVALVAAVIALAIPRNLEPERDQDPQHHNEQPAVSM